MIPYFELKVLLEIGSVQVYTFGTLVGLAIVMGLYVITHRARQMHLDPELAEHLHYWTVGVALVTGHVFTVLVYEPGLLSREGPIVLLKLWDGMSSMGGITSGLLVAVIYLKHKKVQVLPYLDAFFYAFAFAWALARLGCSLVHDHPGALTDSVFAVQYPCDPSQPDGAICPRYDLGVYEFLTFSAVSIYFYITRFKPRMPGYYMLFCGLVLGPLRFAADYLRIDPTAGVGGDQRYAGLTPAQYAIVPLFLLSIYALVKWRGSGELLTPDRNPPPIQEPADKAPSGTKKGKKKKK
jgi:phosphatidylglycerol:prolipoprotein diacylglycerol transferase